MFLGVDGGGSKTGYVLMSADGDILGRHRISGSYHLNGGIAELRSQLGTGLDETLALAGVRKSDLKAAHFGLPAYGEDSRIQEDLDSIPRHLLGNIPYSCDNDMVCAWAGSLAGEDGINIVSGTGSIAYGRRGDKTARGGGWGELFSDEGSAYWIAVRGLNAFSRMSDGRLPIGPLYQLMKARINVASDLDLSGAVMSDYAPHRSKVASLATVVHEASTAGDPVALRIFNDAAAELADVIDGVARRLDFADGHRIPVSYSGGVFQTDDLVANELQRQLRKNGLNAELQTPRFDPTIGAAMLASIVRGELVYPKA